MSKRRANNSKKRGVRYYKLVGVFETEPLRVPNGASFLFRVEICTGRSDKNYHARVYRKETFRLQPTFPQVKGVPSYEPSDEAVWIEDETRDWQELTGTTVNGLLRRVMAQLENTFGRRQHRHRPARGIKNSSPSR